MWTIHQEVRVGFRYPVCFTDGLFGPENPLFKDTVRAGGGDLPKKVLFVVDEGVVRRCPGLLSSIESYCGRYPESLDLVSPPLLVEGGERVKNDPANVELVRDAANGCGLDRHSYIVAVGGGAVLDMVGYATATAHRGVRLVRVPTTVLSQNDSGVGVKNGVNAYGKKNFLGTFAPPHAVLNDFDFLRTLPDREWRGGIPEAVKVALLEDAGFFGFIERNAGALLRRDAEAMRWLVYRCAQLHLEHIATSGDPFESGSSRPLDFGHWAAHKLEQLSDYALRHGEAVAVGLALDSTYAYLDGLLPERDWRRVVGLISALGLPVHVPELGLRPRGRDDDRCVLEGLDEFREHLGGRLTIMLLRRIGEGVEVHEMDRAKILDSIALLERYGANRRNGGSDGSLRHLPADAAAVDR